MKQQGPARIAAFFDLDGTLLPAPSLERRFFRALRYHHKIRLENFLAWLAEAVRLAPKGILAIKQANKMYLRGVRVAEGESGNTIPDFFLKRFSASLGTLRKVTPLFLSVER